MYVAGDSYASIFVPLVAQKIANGMTQMMLTFFVSFSIFYPLSAKG